MRTLAAIVLFIFLASGICPAADICLPASEMSRIVVQLDSCRIDAETNIPAMQAMIDNLNKQTASCEQEVVNCKTVVQHTDEIRELEQPTIWDRIGDFGEDVLIIGGLAAAYFLYTLAH